MKLLLLVLISGHQLLARRGRNHGKNIKMWHMAGDESQCGQNTRIHDANTYKPSTLCNSAEIRRTNRFCICVTKDSLDSDSVQWKYKCGLCELRWKSNENQEKKRLKAQKHKDNMDRFNRMRKERRLRKKEMRRHGRQERHRRKGVKYLHDAQIENINP